MTDNFCLYLTSVVIYSFLLGLSIWGIASSYRCSSLEYDLNIVLYPIVSSLLNILAIIFSFICSIYNFHNEKLIFAVFFIPIRIVQIVYGSVLIFENKLYIKSNEFCPKRCFDTYLCSLSCECPGTIPIMIDLSFQSISIFLFLGLLLLSAPLYTRISNI